MSEMVGAMRRVGSNPLYVRLTANAKRPALRVVLWVAGGLALLATIAIVVPLFTLARLTVDGSISFEAYQTISAISTPASIMCVVGWIFAPLAVFMVVIVATNITTRDVSSDGYELLVLTDLTADERVLAYVATTLYRVRVLLGLVVIMLPSLPVAATWFIVQNLGSKFHWCNCDSLSMGGFSLVEDLAIEIGGVLAAALALGGLMLLSAMVGVGVGLRRRRKSGSPWIAFVVFLFLFCGFFLLTSVGGYVGLAASLAGVWPLALLALRVARRWA